VMRATLVLRRRPTAPGGSPVSSWPPNLRLLRSLRSYAAAISRPERIRIYPLCSRMASITARIFAGLRQPTVAVEYPTARSGDSRVTCRQCSGMHAEWSSGLAA
jgi:hypothetical protein